MPSADALMASVASSDDSAYLLTSDFQILNVNAAFLRFAEANGGSQLLDKLGAAPIFAAMSQPLRELYLAAFRGVQAAAQPWEHEYECSSATLFRRFHMTVYPVELGRLVVIHARRIEAAHSRPPCPRADAIYVRDGVIKMCSNCRRVQNPQTGERWDWVPGYLSRPTHTVSHGLCAPCAAFYWADTPTAVGLP